MQALLICDTIPQFFIKAGTLRVHSVFQHACNLQTQTQELITLQTFGMPLAPRGCILPCDNLLPLFKQGEQLIVSIDQQFIAPSYKIHFKGVPQLSLRLDHHITPTELIRLAQALDDFLPKSAPVNGMYQMLQGKSLIIPAAALPNIQTAIQNLGEWLKNPEVETNSSPLKECFQQLIGLGIGLTPSADDFLVGILLIMDALKRPERNTLATTLTPFLSRTTDISKAMLQNAGEGRYGAQLLALFHASYDLPTALTQVVDYGHSSGHDMLCGAAFALACS